MALMHYTDRAQNVLGIPYTVFGGKVYLISVLVSEAGSCWRVDDVHEC